LASILGGKGGDPELGAMTLKLELGLDFLTMHLPTKFHHPMLNRSEVTVLTNKQTDFAENIQLAPLCYASGRQLYRKAKWYLNNANSY